MGVVMCSTTICSGLMSGSFRNAAILSSRVIVGTVVTVVEGGTMAPEACPAVEEETRVDMPEDPLSSMPSLERRDLPRYCPEMDVAAGGGGMSGRVKGVSSTSAAPRSVWYS